MQRGFEDPVGSAVEVAGVVFVFGDRVGKEEDAEEVDKDGVEGDEEIEGEGPLDGAKGELPPPEVDGEDEQKEGPEKMNPVDLPVAARVLHDCREPAQDVP